jgi:C-terminal peptidase prc
MGSKVVAVLVAVLIAACPVIVPARAKQADFDLWVKAYHEGIQYALYQSWFTRSVKPSLQIQASLDAMALKLGQQPPRVSGDAAKDTEIAADYLRKALSGVPQNMRESLFRAALEGLVGQWDQFAAALNPNEGLFAMFISGFFEEGDGIMLQWSDEKNVYIVVDVLPEMGGDKAGIRIGDEIIAIEGIKSQDMTNEHSYALYRIAQRTGKLRYRVRRAGLEFDVAVEQTMPQERSIQYELRQGGVGHIIIPAIMTFTGLEVVDAVGELVSRGATSIMIDLRKNPGGNLVATWIALSAFVRGDLFMRRTRSGNTVLRSLPVEHVFSGSIAVLVDRYSASAAEIFAMTLKGRPKARIFGDNSDRTYGKGVGQIAFRLANGWYFSMTVSEFADLSGAAYHGRGVEVDEVVASGSTPDDMALNRAIAWLRSQR